MNRGFRVACHVQKEQEKENDVLERVRVGMKNDTEVAKVAKMQLREERTCGRTAVAKRKQRPRETSKGRNQSMLDLW